MAQPITLRFFRYIGREVYGAILPVAEREGAETYFEELWRDAPKKVAVAQFIGALFVFLSPPLILKRFRFLPSLSEDEKSKLFFKLMRSRFYPFRLVAYGVRAHAMVATFRKDRARRSIFGPTDLWMKHEMV